MPFLGKFQLFAYAREFSYKGACPPEHKCTHGQTQINVWEISCAAVQTQIDVWEISCAAVGLSMIILLRSIDITLSYSSSGF